MKSMGMTRKVDPLGRFIIPKELRTQLNIDIGSQVEIFLEEDIIIIRKHSVDFSCMVTGEVLPENEEYIKELFLSPLGAKVLVEKIKQELIALENKY